jgi:putative SOS response-associated peptidase YedK
MQPIHERLPVIIPPDQYGLWLDPRCQDTDKLAQLLRPYPSADMLAYRVRALVNNPRNDVPQCVEATR